MSEKIYGRNPVYETLSAGRREFFKCSLASGIQETPVVQKILNLCRQRKVQVEWVNRSGLTDGGQGVELETSGYPYVTKEDVWDSAFSGAVQPVFLLLDTLQDPQNLGTLLRTAEAVGVRGVFIPPRRAVGVTPAVVNASSGASEHLMIAQGNLANILNEMKKREVWAVGLEGGEDSQPISRAPLKQALALVVGNEGSGLRRLVRKSCDILVNLPMQGKVDSLNASVAGSVALYLIFQARGWQS